MLSDVVITVGSANSSNSVRLMEVALDAGAGASYRVDNADELQPEWFEGATTIGVTSGASVPEILVRDVVDALKVHGYTEVVPVTTVEENVQFTLPKNLRADLKEIGVEPDRPRRERVAGGNGQVSNARGTGNIIK